MGLTTVQRYCAACDRAINIMVTKVDTRALVEELLLLLFVHRERLDYH